MDKYSVQAQRKTVTLQVSLPNPNSLCTPYTMDNIVIILYYILPTRLVFWYSRSSSYSWRWHLLALANLLNFMTWLGFEPWTITSRSHKLNHPAKYTLIVYALFCLVLGYGQQKNHNNEYQRCLRLWYELFSRNNNFYRSEHPLVITPTNYRLFISWKKPIFPNRKIFVNSFCICNYWKTRKLTPN